MFKKASYHVHIAYPRQRALLPEQFTQFWSINRARVHESLPTRLYYVYIISRLDK